jgi:ketosteroid isomerase-like protein
MTVAESPTALARRLIDAFAAADLDRLVELVAEDFVMEIPTAPPGAQKVLTGAGDLAALVGHLAALWTDVRLAAFAATATVDDPGRVLAEYTTEAVQLDGTPYRNDYVGLITVRDGRVTRFQEYFDPTPLAAAIAVRRAHGKAAAAGSAEPG